MQQRVYQTNVQNLHDLRQRLIDVWNGMEQGVIDDAIDQWRKRVFRPKEDTLNIHCSLLISLICSMKICR